MGSRIREKPERLFEVFVEIASPQGEQKNPFILQQFPEDYDDTEALKMVPKFAYPCETDASKVDHFTFVMTDVESMFRFGYCRHATGHETCLCVLSCLPWCEVFFKFLDLLASIANSPDQGNGMMEFLQTAYSQEVPLPGIPVTIVAGENMFNFTSPDPNELPSIPKSRNLTEYYNAVDPHNMMVIFASMVQERRIYMTSKKLSRLTACIHAAEALLYPMHWQHLYIPVLPAHLIDYVSAPMPYLIGIHSNLVEKLKINRVDIGDAVIVDLDSNTVTTEYDDLESLPEDVSSFLKKSLKTDVIRNSMTKNGDAISVAFLQALVRLIGGYREALKYRPQEPITFDPEVFVRSRPSQSTQAYLEGMLALQIFQQFIFGRLEILNTGCGFTDIFEQQATAYTDKMNSKINSQTNYKEWLKSVKKGGRRGKEVLTGLKVKMKFQSKKAFAHMHTKISSMTDNDERRGSSPSSFAVSGGVVHSKDKHRSAHGITEDRKPKRPPRPPLLAGNNTGSSGINKEDSQDDSQLRLSYHTVDMSLMGDQDIQAAMMRSASAEVLPKNNGETWSGSTSTISSDSRSADDTDSANIPFGSLQSSDDESQTSLVDLPPVSYKSQSSNSSQSTNSSEFSTGDRLIIRGRPKTIACSDTSKASKPPVIPPRIPLSQTSSSPCPKSREDPAPCQPLRPPPRKQVTSRQPIPQPHQQPPTDTDASAPTCTLQDAPLIRFESSESEATDSEVFDPLAITKSTNKSGGPTNQSAVSSGENSSSDVVIRPKDDVSSDDTNRPLQRGSSSRSSLTRSQAFRRESNKMPLRKGSGVADDEKEDNEDTSKKDSDIIKSLSIQDPTPVFDPFVRTSMEAKISPGMAAPVQQNKLRRDSSADLMKYEWSLASLAPGPRVYLPNSDSGAFTSQPQSMLPRQSTLPSNTSIPPRYPMAPRGTLTHQGSLQATQRLSGTGHVMPGPGLTGQSAPYRSQPLNSSIHQGTNPQTGNILHRNSAFPQQTIAPSSSLPMSSNQPSTSPLPPPLVQGYPQPNLTPSISTATIPQSHTQQRQSVFNNQTARTQSPFNSPSQNTRTLLNIASTSKQNPSNSNQATSTTKSNDPFGDLGNLVDIQFGNVAKKQPEPSQPQPQQKDQSVNLSTKPPPVPPQPRWQTFD